MGVHLLTVFETDQDDVVRVLQNWHESRYLQDLDADLERLAELLSYATTAYRSHTWLDLEHNAHRISNHATKLGLHRIARVAQAVERLVQGGDGAALAANVARLARLVDDALHRVWHVQNTQA